VSLEYTRLFRVGFFKPTWRNKYVTQHSLLHSVYGQCCAGNWALGTPKIAWKSCWIHLDWWESHHRGGRGSASSCQCRVLVVGNHGLQLQGRTYTAKFESVPLAIAASEESVSSASAADMMMLAAPGATVVLLAQGSIKTTGKHEQPNQKDLSRTTTKVVKEWPPPTYTKTK
jgi:hypothetical protein